MTDGQLGPSPRALESALVVDKPPSHELQTFSASAEHIQRRAESCHSSRVPSHDDFARNSSSKPDLSQSQSLQYPPSPRGAEARVHEESADVDATAHPVVSDALKKAQHRKSMIHLSALYFSYFLQGWNDGTTGPLLPTIQRHYGISTTVVSILFVASCIGYLSGAMSNVYINDRFGFGKAIVLGAIMQLCGYALDAPGGPFAVMCVGYALSGFGVSLQMAHANGFVGGIKAKTGLGFGVLHAWYGLGAFAAPLVVTQFATLPRWSFYYLISAGLSVCNTVVLASVFRLRRQDDILAESGVEPGEQSSAGGAGATRYRQILGVKGVHFMSVWCLIYVGVEVSLGGWIVTFIQEKRGGTASSGYISSGFWAGLMIGRLALNWVNRKVGERRVMFLYTVIAIVLQVTIWVVPSLIENAVAVSFIGLLLGPMYPILMNHCTTILPKWLLTGCVGYISSLGQAGSALLPFVTGLLAGRFGIGALQPLVVSMMSTMMVIWALVPRVRRID